MSEIEGCWGIIHKFIVFFYSTYGKPITELRSIVQKKILNFTIILEKEPATSTSITILVLKYLVFD